MKDTADSFGPDRSSFDAIAEQFTVQCRCGDSPSIDEYAEKHPEFAEQIRRLFPAIETIERLGVLAKIEQTSAQRSAHFRKPAAERLGDYRLVREVGSGGMGVVYEAIQESLGRRVAVKVLSRSAPLDEKHILRFRREARTAARLHHTNIVPVFGSGEQDGQHYYVMQFIQGIGLDELLSALASRVAGSSDDVTLVKSNSASGRGSEVTNVVNALSSGVFQLSKKTTVSSTLDDSSESIATDATTVDNRLLKMTGLPMDEAYCRSFARIAFHVADAIAYAHSQRTLHRDIKPGNLLLTESGAVWVTDFGLAKALENDDVSHTGDVVGTLRYMAPEQFAGQPEPRSDIYSLGLTLYEMLTLTPAYKDSSRAHLIRDIRDQRKVVEPSKLNPAISRDLETIVLKAISLDPRDRYESAQQMASDLECYLEDRPIQARKTTSIEKFSKWCRRNPAVAGLSVISMLLLMLIAISSSIGYFHTLAALQRESQERERAQSEQRKAEVTLGVSLKTLDKIYNRFAPERFIEPNLLAQTSDGETPPNVPSQPTVSKETAALLVDILGFYDGLAKQDIDSHALKLEAAKANRRIGEIQWRLGAYDRAEAAYLKAIEKYERLVETDDHGSFSLPIARIQNELGNVYRSWQRPDDAMRSFEKAFELLQQATTAPDVSDELRFEFARTYYFLAKRQHNQFGASPLLGSAPPPADANDVRVTYLHHAIKILKQLCAGESNQPDYRFLLALCLREIAPSLRAPGIETATQILEELIEQYPGIADYRYELSETYSKMDMRRIRDPEIPRIVDRLRKAAKYADELANNHANIPQYMHSVSHINHKLGTALRRLAGRNALDRSSLLQESKNRYHEAIRVQTLLVEQYPTVASFRLWNAKMQQSLSETLLAEQLYEEAQSMVEKSIASLFQMLEDEANKTLIYQSLAEHHRTLAEIFDRQDKLESASQARKQAEELFDNVEANSSKN
jgi:eukaryotic-like serine/threonine-protein kinase